MQPLDRRVGRGGVGPKQACGGGESQLPEQSHHIPPNRLLFFGCNPAFDF
ncbi:hypothetical protein CDS [Bradyrhizobium sp.]|nr:hypothetical protein CDS [Bradyrhizobium sp.]